MSPKQHANLFALCSVFFVCTFILHATPLGAQVRYPDKPDRKNFFVDEANLIEPQDRETINDIAKDLLVEEIPIIIVTIPSLEAYGATGYSIEEYARGLFDEWGIGSQDRNYGMLLLVAKGNRKARIELGADWAHDYDSQAQEIMDKLIIPQFKAGRFSKGILDGVRGLDALARGMDLPKPTQPWWVYVVFFGGIALAIGVIISLFKSGRKGWGWALIIGLGVLLFFILRNAGGSGGAFGGGSSGGGGASGSW